MEYNEIIKGIVSKLGENKSENYKYLNEQKEIYKNHKNSEIILNEIDNLIFDSLPNSDKLSNSPLNEITQKIVTNLNFKLHSENLEIPILNGFEIKEIDNHQIILLAQNKFFIEQLISDGNLSQTETFEQRINFVNSKTIDFMKSNTSLNSDKSIFYYKDYSNGIFDYKLYIQDFIIVNNGIEKISRSINAFFIEHNFKDFYQLSVSSIPINMPTEVLKLGIVDMENDQITRSLYNMIEIIMDNLKYKNSDMNTYNNSTKTSEIDVPLQKSKYDNNTIDNSNELCLSANNINIDNEIPVITNNEFDYSNIIPTVESITYLVKYCSDIYTQFVNMVNEDEKKNEQFKYEYKIYNYKKSYTTQFEVYIKEKSYNNITCKDFSSFQSAINDGNLKEVCGLDIRLDLDYKKGKNDNLVDCENSFSILFNPYDIKFARKSNFKEPNMTQIENTINDILKKFPTANSIFCTK